MAERLSKSTDVKGLSLSYVPLTNHGAIECLKDRLSHINDIDFWQTQREEKIMSHDHGH